MEGAEYMGAFWKSKIEGTNFRIEATSLRIVDDGD